MVFSTKKGNQMSEENAVIDDAEIKEVPEAIENPDKQPQVDQAIAEITRVASAACFGVGSRTDAVERMLSIGVNLILMGIGETMEKNRSAVFYAVLERLAQAVGIQIQQAPQDLPKDSAPETEKATGTAE